MSDEAVRRAADVRRKTDENMIALSATEPMAMTAIGAVIVDLVRRRIPISDEALDRTLREIAEGATDILGLSDLSAKGAIGFISTLRA